MLVLTRYIGQKIMIGDDIVITVCGVNKGQVSLGLEAPDHIEIWRNEIYEKIQQEKES